MERGAMKHRARSRWLEAPRGETVLVSARKDHQSFGGSSLLHAGREAG